MNQTKNMFSKLFGGIYRQRSNAALVGKVIVLIAGCLSVARLQAQPASLPDQKFWTPNGPVYAILAVSNSVYLGGDFSYVGPRTGPAALFDQASGQPLGSPRQITGTVNAVVPDGAGGWFIGGAFTAVGSDPITNVAHLWANLSLDKTWNARMVGSTVSALALDAGVLYIGGQFSRIGTTNISGLAGLSVAKGALVWNPQLSGSIFAMQLENDLLYVGGNFFNVGNSNRQNLAAISISTASANGWNPTADSTVLALQLSGNTVYVGGQFANAGTKPRNHLAAIDATTGVAASTWNPNPNAVVRALAVGSNTVYVGGDFTTISVASRRGFAALNAANAAAQPLDLQIQGGNTANLVRTIQFTDGSLYIGGQFTNALGAQHVMVVGVDVATSSTLPIPLATDFNGAFGAAFGVNALAQANGEMFVAGDFRSFGGVARQRAAALAIDSGAALPWAPAFDNSVTSLAAGTNGVYAGGYFTNVNTTPAPGLALVDATDGNALPFTFLATNDFSAVIINSVVVNSNAVYVGGAFTVVGGVSRRFVAALDPATGAPITNFNANLGGGFSGVTSLALVGSNLYIAGDFNTVNSGAYPRLVSVLASTGKTNVWLPAPSPNQPVNLLAATADTLYVAGQFSLISGITLNSAAVYSVPDNTLLPIDASLPSFANVTALRATPTSVYVGGSFASIGGENRQNLAVLEADDDAAFQWNPAPDVAPSVITLTDNYAFVGGTFRFMGIAPAAIVNGFFAAFQRTPQTSLSHTGANVQIVTTTGDRTDAVIQSTPSLANPVWTDIATNAPGFTWTNVLPATLPQEFFRVISR